MIVHRNDLLPPMVPARGEAITDDAFPLTGAFQPHAFQLGAGDNLVALVIFRDQHAAAQFRRCRRLRLAGGQRRPW